MANVNHKTISDTDLHVFAYIAASDPGAVGAGIGWLDTSDGTGAWILKVRNETNTGWESVTPESVLDHDHETTGGALDADAIASGAVVLERGGTEADLSAAGPGIVHQATAGAAFSVILCNFGASAAPDADDDSGEGYSVGSRWYDTTADKEYVCLDATEGAAVWADTTAGGGIVSSDITGLDSKTEAVLADTLVITDSEASSALKELAVSGLKALLNAADYDSGWFAVAHSTAYTKAHGLGTYPALVEVWHSANSDGSGERVNVTVISDNYDWGGAIGADATNVYFETGNQDVGRAVSSSRRYANSGYIRILAWL